MLAAALVASFAAVASAAPVSLLATVEASLSLPNTTQENGVVYYYQNGNAGACGWYSQDEDVVVGLPTEFYSKLDSVSPYCGTYVVVTDPRDNTSVTALVADASATNETLSLSIGTWNALNGTESHLSTVNWRFANETETDLAKAALNGTKVSAPAPAVHSSSSSTTTVVAAPSTSSSSSAAPVETTSSAAAVRVAAATSSAAPAWTEEKETTTTTTTTTTSQWVAPTTTTTQWVTPTTTTTHWVAPTTTTKAWTPEPTTTQAKATQASYSSGDFSGRGTYYFQGGAAGSCGVYNSDSAYIVAVNSAQMNSGLCGKTVHIKNTANGQTVTATVADTCPSCSYGSLDLSEAAFGAIGSYGSGVLPISWSFA
ncbi:hypothetical protein JCM11251_004437 [Rhodosporidiobolus azoricus]